MRYYKELNKVLILLYDGSDVAVNHRRILLVIREPRGFTLDYAFKGRGPSSIGTPYYAVGSDTKGSEDVE